MHKKTISAERLQQQFDALNEMLRSGDLTAQQHIRECGRLNARYTVADEPAAVVTTEPAAEPEPAAPLADEAPPELATSEPAPEPAATPPQAQLPQVPKDCVAVPTILARAPIFRLDAADGVDSFDKWQFAAMAGVNVEYAGPRLGMRDAHVFHALLLLAQAAEVGAPVVTTRGAVLRAAGLATGSASYAALEQSLLRLSRAHLTVRGADGWWSATLLVSPAAGTRAMEFRLDPRILDAYTSGNWSSARMPVFRAVNPGLASRLYMLLAQYPDGFYHTVPQLMALMGTSSKTQGDFAKLLRAALPKLLKAGAITAWNIKQDGKSGNLRLSVTTRSAATAD